MADYYQLLGVPSNASESEIRMAYRKKAKLFHPDVNKSPDAHSKFVLITTAYETLVNDKKRELYNIRSKASTSMESYSEWIKAQRAKAEYEARMRYYEYLRNKEKFRESNYYTLALIITHIARIVSILFGTTIIGVCLVLIIYMHFVLAFFLLPFICGGVYLIKWSNDWFKDAKKYF